MGACLEARDKKGFASLHYAVYFEKIEVAKILIEYGSQIESICNEGQTPLHLAATIGNSEIVKHMIFHGAAYLEAKDGYGNTALHFAAAAFGKLNVIKILIENGAQTDPNTNSGEIINSPQA